MPTLMVPSPHREDPAVAGQRVAVAVAHVEGALDPRVGVQRALEVAADRHALRVAPVAGGAERAAEARVATRRRSRRSGRGSRAVVARRPCPSRRRRRRGRRASTGAHRLGALEQRGARPRPPARRPSGRGRGGARRSRGREHRVLGPLQLERDAVGDGAQPVVAVVVASSRSSSPMSCELLDRPRREPVAAGLLAGKRFVRRTTTSWPASASQYAAAAPAGPPPTTRTSWRSCVLTRRRPCRIVRRSRRLVARRRWPSPFGLRAGRSRRGPRVAAGTEVDHLLTTSASVAKSAVETLLGLAAGDLLPDVHRDRGELLGRELVLLAGIAAGRVAMLCGPPGGRGRRRCRCRGHLRRRRTRSSGPWPAGS